MANHTPGPWTADTDRHSWGGPLPPAIKAGKVQLAIVECRESMYTPEGDLDEEGPAVRDRANAQLIAAAPDLLAACEVIRPLLFAERQASDSSEREAWDAAMRILDAAIAQALGKT